MSKQEKQGKKNQPGKKRQKNDNQQSSSFMKEGFGNFAPFLTELFGEEAVNEMSQNLPTDKEIIVSMNHQIELLEQENYYLKEREEFFLKFLQLKEDILQAKNEVISALKERNCDLREYRKILSDRLCELEDYLDDELGCCCDEESDCCCSDDDESDCCCSDEDFDSDCEKKNDDNSSEKPEGTADPKGYEAVQGYCK